MGNITPSTARQIRFSETLRFEGNLIETNVQQVQKYIGEAGKGENIELEIVPTDWKVDIYAKVSLKKKKC